MNGGENGNKLALDRIKHKENPGRSNTNRQ